MSMSTFETLYQVPLVHLSDQIQPPARQLARERIKKYRQKQIVARQDAPPVGSRRRVFWAASKGSQRNVIARFKSRVWGWFERLMK